MRRSTTTLFAVLALGLLGGCGDDAPEAAQDAAIEWGSCDKLASDVAEFNELIGTPSPLEGWADRMECGTLSVPLDYEKPEGRQVTIAVSRLLPTEQSTGVVLTNPGGPGLEGRTLPAIIAASGMADLAKDLTIVGIDARGTGGSTTVECDPLAELEAPAEPVDEKVALAYSEQIAAANRACVETDREFFEQLTTQNAARDLDRVREALDVEKVAYYGTSWGTELGAAYLGLFPGSVERMLLDSVTDLRQDAGPSLDDLATALAAWPAASDDGGAGGLAAPPAYVPFSTTTRTALTCNAYTGASDAAALWDAHMARAAAHGLDAQQRIAHPVSADLAGTSVCAGWPLEPQPIDLPSGDHEALQIVVHKTETVTPAVWGEHAHDVLGGHLSTLDDGDHGSLASSTAAAAAVAFLRDGTPMP